MIHLFINLSIQSQSVRVRRLKFWEKVHLPPLACVRYHMSCVMCHISHAICHLFYLQSGEASQWRVCYQWALHVPAQRVAVTFFFAGQDVTGHQTSPTLSLCQFVHSPLLTTLYYTGFQTYITCKLDQVVIRYHENIFGNASYKPKFWT